MGLGRGYTGIGRVKGRTSAAVKSERGRAAEAAAAAAAVAAD
jgi:hypothetical protein